MNLDNALFDPSADLPQEELDKLGTIVTAQPTKKATEIEKKIKDIHTPVGVQLDLTGEQHTRLLRLCMDRGVTPSQYLTSIIIDDLNAAVGRSTITGPSKIGKVSTAQKVTGPSNMAKFR